MSVRPVVRQVDRRAEEVRTPGRAWPGVRRLVVVRHDRLGDFVLTLPAIDALRRTYPEAQAALVVSPGVRPLAERVPGIDRVAAVPPHARGLGRWLADFAPDLVVCISRSAGPALAAWRARVPHRVGTARRIWSPLFHRTVRESRRSGARHEVEFALSFAHRAGASAGPARFPLATEPVAETRVERWLAASRVGRGFVLLVPGSGSSCPRWPGRHHGELATRLMAAGVPVVINAGPDDERALDEVRDGGPAIDAPVFREGPVELLSLVARAGLVVGSSTGPIHLAAAVGTPALALHAPWPSCAAGRWGPYHDRGFALVAAVGRRGSDRDDRILADLAPRDVARVALAIRDGRDPAAELAQPSQGA